MTSSVTPMNYQQALDYIYGFVNYETAPTTRDAAHFDLRRMDELLLKLGNPHHAAKSVHVAGTKGKGSTSAMIASVLTAAGYVTGLYTSPHLVDLRERIQVNGKLITENELIALVQKLKADIEAVDRQATYGRLTTFEVLTALAFADFQQKRVEFQVLEVGLGGRLDATNVIYPEVAVITSISYDHTEVLGDTLAKIAGEKAGIIKPGGVVVTSPQLGEALEVIERIALERGATLIKVGREVTWRGTGFDLDGQSLEISGRLDRYKVTIPLLGEHQMENAATAVAALEVLKEKGYKVSGDSMVKGLAQVNWPGRFQILSRKPFLVVDGAHNADSALKLKQALGQYFGLSVGGKKNKRKFYGEAVLVFGSSFDKDISGMVAQLARLFDSVIITSSRHPRAMISGRLKDEFGRYGVTVELADGVPSALSRARALAGEHGLICATGSLFVVAETLEELGKPATR